jgi:hypothetical protein
MSTAWKDPNRGKWYHEYRKRRAPFLAERPDCEQKIEGVCTGRAKEVHHVLGIAVDKLDTRYWKASCRECNVKTGDPNAGKQPKPRTLTTW